jgi:hypothetical protein
MVKKGNGIFWGNIDPFLIGLIVILLSTWYALPKLSADYEFMQMAFYASAAFLLIFDAYARGLFSLPEFVTKGPLVSVLIIISGFVAFVVLFLSIPYLITAFLMDLLSMFGSQLDYGETSWVILGLGVVGALYFASFLNRTITENKRFESMQPQPIKSMPASKPNPKRKAGRKA